MSTLHFVPMSRHLHLRTSVCQACLLTSKLQWMHTSRAYSHIHTGTAQKCVWHWDLWECILGFLAPSQLELVCSVCGRTCLSVLWLCTDVFSAHQHIQTRFFLSVHSLFHPFQPETSHGSCTSWRAIPTCSLLQDTDRMSARCWWTCQWQCLVFLRQWLLERTEQPWQLQRPILEPREFLSQPVI